jgi:signal transduction histidine kinase
MSLFSKRKILIASLAAFGAALLFVLNPRMASSIAWAHAYCYLNQSRLIWLHSISAIYVATSVVTAVALPPFVPEREEFVRTATSSDEPRAGLEEGTTELVRANEMLLREIKKRVQTEEMLRKLSGRVLTLQDDERRRLGRELHDSAGQLLAALHINLGIIAQWTKDDPRVAAKLADTAALADQAITEIRTLSYLLHPPMLDETGLASAVEWYVRGFSERSKIAVTLEVDPGLRRFPRDVETAIFRIIQECLVNIHRHSGSRTAFISLRSIAAGAALTVRDEGRGIPQEVLMEDGLANLGVGIRGMRERARQLGGLLDIRSGNPGTLVEVNLPALKSAGTRQAAMGEAAG